MLVQANLELELTIPVNNCYP